MKFTNRFFKVVTFALCVSFFTFTTVTAQNNLVITGGNGGDYDGLQGRGGGGQGGYVLNEADATTTWVAGGGGGASYGAQVGRDGQPGQSGSNTTGGVGGTAASGLGTNTNTGGNGGDGEDGSSNTYPGVAAIASAYTGGQGGGFSGVTYTVEGGYGGLSNYRVSAVGIVLGEGGKGGDAAVTLPGDVYDNVTIISGTSGSFNPDPYDMYHGVGGTGGAATLNMSGTLTAASITVTKKDGAVSANIGTLDVSANTTITVDGTAATDAIINTVNVTAGQTLTIASLNSGKLTINNLNIAVGGSVTGDVSAVLPALALSTSSLSNGTVDEAYSTSIAANASGFAPYSFTLSGGSSLPAGLNISNTGTISGTPAAAVTGHSFSITVTDAIGRTTTQTFTITVDVATTYGLIFNVGDGKFYLDKDNSGAYNAGDTEYTGQSLAWSWNSATTTLSLNGFEWETSAERALTIVGAGTLNLNLTGTNKFTSTINGVSSMSTAGIYAAGITLNLDGSGTLNTTAGNTTSGFTSEGIRGNIILYSGTVNVVGRASVIKSQGIMSSTVTVYGGTLNVSCDNEAIYGDVTLINGAINVAGGAASNGLNHGISGNVTLTGGVLNVSAGDIGITSTGPGTVSISGGTVTIQGGTRAIAASHTVTPPAAYKYWTNTSTADPLGAGTQYPGGTPYTHNLAYKFVKIEAMSLLAGAVTITGTAIPGVLLTADISGITSAAPLGTLTYQWKSGGTPVGTNSSAYTVATADIGQTITVEVSAANYAGSLTSAGVTVTVPDLTPPTPGSSGALTATGLTPTTLTLDWTAATDNVTPPASLRYYVYRSTSANIGTPAECTANGTLLNTGGTAGLTTFNVTGLTEATTYYFNVVVEDGAGNEAVYTSISATTTRTIYSIQTSTSGAGIVSADRTTAYAGETVTLTITPGTGYELASLTASGLTLTTAYSGRYTFVMPANDVTVNAVFKKTARQLAWETVIPLIEAATFTLTQAEAADATAARYRLAALINALLAPHGFAITAGDIVIFRFDAATAGDAVKLTGVNGLFEFRVSPSDVSPSAYNECAITATPFDDTANDVIGATVLTASVLDGTLHVGGLTSGELWSVYNLSGTLVYRTVATASEAQIRLPGRGVYVVVSGNETVKVFGTAN